tara:strand:- start:3567 stop:4451 length:885 start_codon:yes stop_codon:yes gene_type:complete
MAKKSLKARKPEAKGIQRARIIISGAAGVGKTYFSLDFPKCYFIDVEGSAVRDHYQEKLEQSGGAYFGRAEGAGSINSVIDEVIALATVEHDYQTLVIDSFTELYNAEAAKAEIKVGNDFGADKREANKPTRRLLHWVNKLDMNVILICHPADKWGKNAKGESEVVGSTFDGMKKLDHKLDVWLEVSMIGKTRKAKVRKSRIKGLDTGSSFPLKFPEFSKRFGAELIEKETEQAIVPAPEEKVTLLDSKRREAGIGQATVDSWLEAAGVEELYQLTEQQVDKCLTYCEDRINAS